MHENLNLDMVPSFLTSACGFAPHPRAGVIRRNGDRLAEHDGRTGEGRTHPQFHPVVESRRDQDTPEYNEISHRNVPKIRNRFMIDTGWNPAHNKRPRTWKSRAIVRNSSAFSIFQNFAFIICRIIANNISPVPIFSTGTASARLH